MRPKIKLILSSILWLTFNASTYAQQSVMKPIEIWKPISIDSVPNIKINRIVYYSKPIEFKYFALTDTSYIPVWYKTFCASSNIDYFKDYPKEAIHYFSAELGLTESDLKAKYEEIIKSGGIQEYYKNSPENKYLYIFDEILLTTNNSNTNYLLIQGFYSEKEIQNLNFSTKIIQENNKNEKVDSIKNIVKTHFIFKVINDTLKWVDQSALDNIVLIDKHFIDPDLHNFKDMCFKRAKYFQSEIENGKRVFKTMEKDTNGIHKVTKVGAKPDLDN